MTPDQQNAAASALASDDSADVDTRALLFSLLTEPVPADLVPHIIVAFDRLAFRGAIDSQLVQAWSELVAAVAPRTIRTLSALPARQGTSPVVRLWSMNRVAACTLVADVAWCESLAPTIRAELERVAQQEPAESLRQLVALAGVRVSDELVAAWDAADTPARRWNVRHARGRPLLRPLSAEAELSLMEAPEGLAVRAHPCPVCQSLDAIRWFLIPDEPPPSTSLASTWVSVCMSCRLRLSAFAQPVATRNQSLLVRDDNDD